MSTSTIERPRTAGPGSGLGGNWRVIVRNDNHNTFDHVARTLSRVLPGVSLEQGHRIADQIHNGGQAIVWTGPREPAEHYWEQLAGAIDGVLLLLLGAEEPARWPAAEPALIGGTMHLVSLEAGERLRQLEERFEVVWASGWERRSNELSRRLDLPDFPYLTFKGAARFGSANWKTEPLENYARGRPLAWIDDSLDEHCYRWARNRPEPTLLVETEPRHGLQEVHVEALMAWARSLTADSPGGAAGGSSG
jgi:ATP-dependent Clp protease adaptor protein ClpS